MKTIYSVRYEYNDHGWQYERLFEKLSDAIDRIEVIAENLKENAAYNGGEVVIDVETASTVIGGCEPSVERVMVIKKGEIEQRYDIRVFAETLF